MGGEGGREGEEGKGGGRGRRGRENRINLGPPMFGASLRLCKYDFIFARLLVPNLFRRRLPSPIS
jgi:hypothetical protein